MFAFLILCTKSPFKLIVLPGLTPNSLLGLARNSKQQNRLFFVFTKEKKKLFVHQHIVFFLVVLIPNLWCYQDKEKHSWISFCPLEEIVQKEICFFFDCGKSKLQKFKKKEKKATELMPNFTYRLYETFFRPKYLFVCLFFASRGTEAWNPHTMELFLDTWGTKRSFSSLGHQKTKLVEENMTLLRKKQIRLVPDVEPLVRASYFLLVFLALNFSSFCNFLSCLQLPFFSSQLNKNECIWRLTRKRAYFIGAVWKK